MITVVNRERRGVVVVDMACLTVEGDEVTLREEVG